MNDAEIELIARLNLHELLLELVCANGAMTAANPSENWQAFSAGIIEKTRLKATAQNDAADSMLVHTRLIAMTERFCERVAERVVQGYQ